MPGYLDVSTAGRADSSGVVNHPVSTGLDVRIALASNTWASQQRMVRKWAGGGDNRCWDFYLNATGQMALTWSTDGTAGAQETEISATAVHTKAGVSDGDDLWLRTTLQFNDGGAYRVTYYWSIDSVLVAPASVSWTDFAEDDVGGATTSVFDSVTGLDVGANGGSGDVVDGPVYVCTAQELGGSLFMNPDWRDADQGDWSSPPVTDDHTNSFDLLGTAFWVPPSDKSPSRRRLQTPRRSLARRHNQVFS